MQAHTLSVFIKGSPVIKVKHCDQTTKINQKPNKEARVKKQALICTPSIPQVGQIDNIQRAAQRI